MCWNALISGYAPNGLGDDALKCFKQMQHDGISPNVLPYSGILKICGNFVSLEVGEELHAEIRKQGLLQKDAVFGTTLIEMFARHGAFSKVRNTLEELPN